MAASGKASRKKVNPRSSSRSKPKSKAAVKKKTISKSKKKTTASKKGTSPRKSRGAARTAEKPARSKAAKKAPKVTSQKSKTPTVRRKSVGPAPKPKKGFRVIRKVSDMKKYIREQSKKNKRLALVPTMGSLHEGHQSLIREAHRLAKIVVVSVFVNPAQFGPGEDLDRYPRDLSGDRRKIKAEGADVMFAPDAAEIYPEGFQTMVEVTEVASDYCGASRPGFFRGVATVVNKLFNIVKPDVAVFGEKDFQQLITIRRMVEDLNMAIEVVGMPTLRDEDGLAMSSRNSYLSPAQRQQATAIYRGLRKARRLCESGELDAAELAAVVLDLLREERELEIDYVAVCDTETLERIPEVEKKAVVLVAVYVGDTRLIDNIVLTVKRRR